MKGKNFSLKSNKRNKNDYYQTPYSMTRQLLEVENFEGKILEPCCGAGAIVKVLKDYDKSVDYCDLNNEFSLTGIFKNFKDFINNEIYLDRKFPLKAVYVFCSYGMLEETIRDDGTYRTGMMVYAWYIWEKSYKLGEPMIRWLNNNSYVRK